MDTIFAYKLFENKDLLKSVEIEPEKHITIDFRKVKEFNLQNIHTLISLQKIALFNNAKLDIKNAAPLIQTMLSQIGLYKTLYGFSNKNMLTAKRINF